MVEDSEHRRVVDNRGGRSRMTRVCPGNARTSPGVRASQLAEAFPCFMVPRQGMATIEIQTVIP
jgi:hypothetical protein